MARYQSAEYGWSFHILKSFTDAQDLAQETFIEAYFNLPTLKEPNKFASWLRSITTNLCISWLRRQKSLESFEKLTEETSEEDILKLMTNQQIMPTPAEEYEKKELWETVMDAIGKLPQRNQVVITMYYLDGLSYRDIAAFLSVSESAVKSRLHRARNQLKEEMDEMTKEVLSQQHLSEEFRDEIRSDISGIREEIEEIREILDTQFSLDNAIRRIHHLRDNNSIRWGIIGAYQFEKGHKMSVTNIRTTDLDNYFTTTNEEVLDFIKVYNNAEALTVMRQLFYGAKTKKELLKSCQLTEEQFDNAIDPLVEAGLLEWAESEQKNDEVLKGKGHGLNNLLTIMLMAMAMGLKKKMAKSSKEK